MPRIIVEFDKLPWESPEPGLRQKAFVSGNQRLRLIEFSNQFEEKGWCTKGHAIHVLEGELTLHMKDGPLRMRQGAIGVIEAGESHSHRVVMSPGQRALLLLFELLLWSRQALRHANHAIRTAPQGPPAAREGAVARGDSGSRSGKCPLRFA
jgi:quercetin dioxygenase-like cupin family protein